MRDRVPFKNAAINALIGGMAFMLGMRFHDSYSHSSRTNLEPSGNPTIQTPELKHHRSLIGSADQDLVNHPRSPDSDEQSIKEEIESRASKGWPVLGYEDPDIRRHSDKFCRDTASAAAEANKAGYDAFYQNLGLSAEDSERLQQHTKNIHRAMMEYEFSQQELLGAKLNFEKDLKTTLTAEQFTHYLDFEKGRRADLELARMEHSLSKTSGEALDAESRHKVQKLLKEHEAYTEEFSRSAFDPIPRVAVGREQVAVRLAEVNEQLNQKAARLLEASASTAIRPSIQKFLQEYYADKSKQLLREIESIKTRPELPKGKTPLP